MLVTDTDGTFRYGPEAKGCESIPIASGVVAFTTDAQFPFAIIGIVRIGSDGEVTGGITTSIFVAVVGVGFFIAVARTGARTTFLNGAA